MKKAATLLAALAVAFAATAATVRTATETFVTNRIAESVGPIAASAEKKRDKTDLAVYADCVFALSDSNGRQYGTLTPKRVEWISNQNGWKRFVWGLDGDPVRGWNWILRDQYDRWELETGEPGASYGYAMIQYKSSDTNSVVFPFSKWFIDEIDVDFIITRIDGVYRVPTTTLALWSEIPTIISNIVNFSYIQAGEIATPKMVQEATPPEYTTVSNRAMRALMSIAPAIDYTDEAIASNNTEIIDTITSGGEDRTLTGWYVLTNGVVAKDWKAFEITRQNSTRDSLVFTPVEPYQLSPLAFLYDKPLTNRYVAGEYSFYNEDTSDFLTVNVELVRYEKKLNALNLAQRFEVEKEARRIDALLYGLTYGDIKPYLSQFAESAAEANSLVIGNTSIFGWDLWNILSSHTNNFSNPHGVTAAQIGATTPADVTAAIREQSLGGIWDEELQVWWTPRMRNGSLTYEATTNVNLNAEN